VYLDVDEKKGVGRKGNISIISFSS